ERCMITETMMLNIRGFSAVVLTAAIVPALLLETASGQQQPAPPVSPMPPVLRNYHPVTAERLKNPEAGNWLMIRRTYDGWGYSPLTEITPDNVKRLQPVWVFSTA